MIKLGPEPEGVLLRRADIFAWLPGLSVGLWKKIRPTLRTHKLPGCRRPHYYKAEIRARLVEPMRRSSE